MKNNKISPVLKWAGGKTQIKKIIIAEIEKYLDISKSTYFEPFLGGGAILFSILPKKAVINDVNSELINVYKIIKYHPKDLMKKIQNFKESDSEDFYYKVRSWDREPRFKKRDKIELAARTIYLNKTCYNGLYRVNKSGYFNTPRGKYKNPSIYDEKNILKMSKYFNENKVNIYTGNYSRPLKQAEKGDVVYFDPPYDYEKGGFTQYSSDGFSRRRLLYLKKRCDELIDRGCIVFISNNNTKYVNELFKGNNYKIIYKKKIIEANRVINSSGNKRKKVEEVLIRGYKK